MKTRFSVPVERVETSTTVSYSRLIKWFLFIVKVFGFFSVFSCSLLFFVFNRVPCFDNRTLSRAQKEITLLKTKPPLWLTSWPAPGLHFSWVPYQGFLCMICWISSKKTKKQINITPKLFNVLKIARISAFNYLLLRFYIIRQFRHL